MKKIVMIIAALAIIFIILLSPGRERAVEHGFELEVIAENLDTLWAIDFLPDGTMIFTERDGRVSMVKNSEVHVIAQIEVNQRSESGLHGIAVDPEFERNNFVYVYYTHDAGNRVSRFFFKKNKLQEEFILLDAIPHARFHDGGRVKFGPDGMLYVTTGDATVPSTAQNISSLAGKILRMNKDGSAPKGNPFGNYVYSYGHRNSQGLAWHPFTKELYASEHGPTRNDEINLILKGENYGWPRECTESPDDYTTPLRCYTEFTLAPAGIAFYGNDLYVSALRGTQLRKITFGSDGQTIVSEEELLSDLGRIRDAVAHDGYLYIATSNRDGRGLPKVDDDKIIRIKILKNY